MSEVAVKNYYVFVAVHARNRAALNHVTGESVVESCLSSIAVFTANWAVRY